MLEEDSIIGNLSITHNLDIALRHIRLANEPRLLWIDALCINQTDDEEKSRQVAMMGSIYSLASHVILWLGPESQDSDDALDILEYIGSQFEYDSTTKLLKLLPSSDEIEWADTQMTMPFRSGELDAICALFERPYFSRTWTRQEVALASCASIRCGMREISWPEFQAAVICMSKKSWYLDALKHKSTGSYGDAVRLVCGMCRLIRGSFRLADIRFMFQGTKCQDKRDVMYAVLSLLTEEEGALAITPDYHRTVEALYVDVASRVVQRQRKLHLLGSCELSSKVLDLPSWVPDWSQRTNFDYDLVTKWSACAWLSAPSCAIQGDCLHAKGVLVGSVTRTTELSVAPLNQQVCDLIRKLRPADVSPSSLDWFIRVERCCRVLTNDDLSDEYLPRWEERPDLEQSIDIVNRIWSAEEGDVDPLKGPRLPGLAEFFGICAQMVHGRCIFTMGDDRIGLGPNGTHNGDVVCVLLGCRFPVILRPSSSRKTWQVVGVCFLPGLMNGEAIYGRPLPKHYRPVWEFGRAGLRIDNGNHVIYSTETETTIDNPAQILTEMGIKVETYQREPHILEVFPESLEAAGVALQNFTLV